MEAIGASKKLSNFFCITLREFFFQLFSFCKLKMIFFFDLIVVIRLIRLWLFFFIPSKIVFLIKKFHFLNWKTFNKLNMAMNMLTKYVDLIRAWDIQDLCYTFGMFKYHIKWIIFCENIFLVWLKLIYTGVLGSFRRVGDAGVFSLLSGSVLVNIMRNEMQLIKHGKDITKFKTKNSTRLTNNQANIAVLPLTHNRISERKLRRIDDWRWLMLLLLRGRLTDRN